MRIQKDYYQVQINQDFENMKRIVCFSDLHYGKLSFLFYQKFLNQFYQDILFNYRQKTLNMILIPGDLLLYITTYLDTSYFELLKNDLKNLAQSLGVPVCISYGNHDFPLSINEKNKESLDLAIHLDNRENGIYVLNNEQVTFGDICVTGFSPCRDAYNTLAMPNPALDIAYEEYQKCNFTFSNDVINILMSHDNKFFSYPEAASRYGKLYEALTLIVGGHLHDGYVPIWLQNLFRESLADYGIWESFSPKIDMCRGAFKVSSENTSSVILPNANICLDSKEALSIVLRGVAKYSWFLPATPSYTEVELISNVKKLSR